MVLSYSLFRFLLAVVAVHHDRSPKSLDLWFVSRLMLCNQKREDGRQQHKNERLHNAHEYFHEIEGKRQERRKPRVHGRHRLQNAFPRVNISKKPEAKRNRPEQNGNNFEPAYHEENDNHDYLQKNYRGFLPAIPKNSEHRSGRL